jgi:hypothetical protein
MGASPTSTYFQKSAKKFKKVAVKKQDYYPRNQPLGKNSLMLYTNSHNKTKSKTLIDKKYEMASSRNTSSSKVSKIELDVTRHCLKKKRYLNSNKSSIKLANFTSKQLVDNKFSESFKTEFSEQSVKNGEEDTRTNSEEYDRCEVPTIHVEMESLKIPDIHNPCDGSFMYADMDLGLNKEASKGETKVSERMTTKVYKTLATNLRKMFVDDRSYG